MLKQCYLLIPVLALFFATASYAQGNNPVIYICSTQGQLNGSLILLNGMTLTEIERIPLKGARPFTIALRPDKRIAFVGNDPLFIKGMLVIDLVEKRLIKTMLEENDVRNVRIGPDGFLYVLLPNNQEVDLIDTQTFEIKRRILFPQRPISINFSPDGKLAYVVTNVLNESKGSGLFAVDLESFAIAKSNNELPIGARDIAVSPDGNFLYIAGQNLISVVDTTNLKIIDPLPGTSSTLTLQISRDGRTLYAADFFSPVIAIDIPSRKAVKQFKVASDCRFLTLSPDGQILYGSNLFGSIFIIDTKTNTTLGFHNYDQGFGNGIAIDGDFSIAALPNVEVLAPLAGEIVQRGKTFTTRWQTTSGGFNIGSHIVELSTDCGQNFRILPFGGELSSETQQFEFGVPLQFIANAQIRITAIDIGGRRASTLSGIFSIGDRPPDPTADTQPPTVRFVSPLGSERLTVGDNLMITWSSSDNTAVTSQDLSISTDGGNSFSRTLVSGLAGQIQSFIFSIPTDLVTQRARLRLVVRDAAGNSAQTITPADFQIQAPADTQTPTVTISRPSGEIFPAGQPITVNWQSRDNVAVVSQQLLLSLDGGTSFQTIGSFGPDTSTFVLSNIPGLEKTTPRALVKITAIDAAGNRGEQSADFTLAPVITQVNFTKPELTITGIGFTSNTGQVIVKVLVNMREEAASRIVVLSNTSIRIRGNKKTLGLVRGTNSIQLMIDNVLSSSAGFQF